MFGFGISSISGGGGVELTADLHQVSRLRISGAIPPLLCMRACRSA
jgi:hypothetical protein